MLTSPSVFHPSVLVEILLTHHGPSQRGLLFDSEAQLLLSVGQTDYHGPTIPIDNQNPKIKLPENPQKLSKFLEDLLELSSLTIVTKIKEFNC
jgi:hypothetical protein